MDPQVFRCKVLNTLHVQEVFVKVGYMGPQVYKCKVLNTFHVHEVYFSKLDIWIPRLPGPGIQVPSIEYFSRAKSIFLKLDIWTPRYLGAKY